MNIFFLFIIFFLSWMLVYFQYKSKIIERILAVLSCVTLLLSIASFFTGYDLAKSAWEDLKHFSTVPSEIDYSATSLSKPTLQPTAPPAPLQVLLPDSIPSSTSAPERTAGSKSNVVCETAIYNIGDSIQRNSDDKIHITWLPLANQDSYKLKIEADDPFLDVETEHEYTCKDNWCDVNVSDYPGGTLLFASVAVWNPETNEWVYSEPISFTLR